MRNRSQQFQQVTKPGNQSRHGLSCLLCYSQQSGVSIFGLACTIREGQASSRILRLGQMQYEKYGIKWPRSPSHSRFIVDCHDGYEQVAISSSSSRFLMTFLLRSRLVRCRRSFAKWQLSEAWPKGTSRAGAPRSFSSVDATGCNINCSITTHSALYIAPSSKGGSQGKMCLLSASHTNTANSLHVQKLCCILRQSESSPWYLPLSHTTATASIPEAAAV